MNTILTNTILDDIIKCATQHYEVEGVEDNSDKQITIHYAQLGQGSVISQRINELMAQKYPHQDYRIKMYPQGCQLVISLMGV